MVLSRRLTGKTNVTKEYWNSAEMERKMRILLVEDDPEIGMMLKDYLETENFEVVMAHDGREACDKFAASRFDLVLLDLMIPVVSGMEDRKSVV